MDATQWLDGETHAQLREVQTPFARPSVLARPERLLDWGHVSSVLTVIPADEVLVVARGELLPLPVPRTVNAIQQYLANGVGLCLRRTERHHATLAQIAAELTPLGTAHVQLFVTPGQSYGLRWHYDDEHVLIVQTRGEKDYYFRANTVAQTPAHPSQFARFEDEETPIMMATLEPGDVLYLPARWWHMARCKKTSLSVSVGITPRTGISAAS